MNFKEQAMKKKDYIIILALILTFMATSCSLGQKSIDVLLNSEEDQIVHDNFMKLLKAVKDKDKDGIKKMFAKNIVRKVDDFESEINKFIEYYDQSKLKSYDDWGALSSDGEFDKGESKIIVKSTYDIVTDKNKFRIAIKECIQDTSVSGNVGIHSLYIIKKEEDNDPEYAYWGDGEDTPGINIEK